MEKRIMIFKGFVFVLMVAALALAGCSDGGGGGAAPVQKAPAKVCL